MNRLKIFAWLVIISLSGCSYVPFIGGDDGEQAPAEKKPEKIKKALIYISKNKEQCEDDTGDSEKVTKARLEASGVKVYSSQCAKITGKMNPSLCGSTTLDINVHEVNEKNFPQTEKLGFETIESLEDADLDYRVYPCDL